MPRFYPLTAVLVALFCGASASAQQSVAHVSQHRVLRIEVEPDVEIEVLDWGGSGPALVFLPGLTLNAHYYDDLAQRFVGRFRSVGITPRGHGASSWPDSGYDLGRRVEDLRSVLDSLGIDRAVLVGHSLTGDDLTAFAGSYPQRVLGLIYVDAAHDHTKGPRCSRDSVDAADTLEEQVEWAFAGAPVPEWVVRTQMRIDDDGNVAGSYAHMPAIPLIFEGMQAPDYSRIRAPALGLYFVPRSIEDLFAGIMDPSAECVTSFQRYIYGGIADFTRGLERGKVVALQETTHHMVVVSPDAVEAIMRAWLEDLDLGAHSPTPASSRHTDGNR